MSKATARPAQFFLADWSKIGRGHLGAAAVIVAMTAILFAPVLQGGSVALPKNRSFSMVGAHMFAQYPWLGVIKESPEIGGRGYPQTDHAETFYPASVFGTTAVRSGQVPMWLPYSFNGIPIMEVGIGTGLSYPPKLLAMFFLSPIRQHDFILFTHLLLAGLGMYGLLRCWDANCLGALLGSAVWELNGHNAFWLTLEHVAIAAAWFPVMLLGATLAVRRQSWRWALISGIALGMSLLNGISEYGYMSALVLVFMYLVLTIPRARSLFLSGQKRSALLALSLPLIGAVVAIALSTASWLPLLGLLTHVHRQPASLAGQLALAIPFRPFVQGVIFPWSSVSPAGKGSDFASFAFVGIPALIFVPAGFFRRSVLVILAGIAGLVSLGIVLGVRPLIIFLRLVLPYFGTWKLHDGFYLLCFAIAVLAGMGLSETSRRIVRPDLSRYLLFALASPLIGAQVLQLILFAWIINPSQPVRPEWLFPETPLIANLKSLQGQFHILPVQLRDPAGKWTPPVLAGKVAADFELRSGSGYESLLPLSTANLWRSVEQGGVVGKDIPPAYRPYFYYDQLPLSLLEKLSIGFIVTPPDTLPRSTDGSDLVADGSLQLVYQGADGWIYKVTHALPRATLVPQVTVAPDSDTALRMLIDPKFDARDAAIVIGENAASKTGLTNLNSSTSDSGGTATIVKDRLNEVAVEVNTPRAAMMVLNDSWDRGWKARVDGVEQPVLKVNYAFRGVVVPEGKHRITFLYRPTLLLIGVGISGVTTFLLMIVCGWAVLRRVRQCHMSSQVVRAPQRH